MLKVAVNPQFWTIIDERTDEAATELQKLLEAYVAPVGQKAVTEALFNLRIDLIAATVRAAGGEWQD